MPPLANTKLMDNLKTLLAEKGLAAGTINLYLSKLVKLNDGKPFSSIVFLKDFKKIKAKMDAMENLNTRKSFVTAVVSVLNNLGKAKEYVMVNLLYKSLLESDKIRLMKEDPHTKTPAQQANWIEWTEIMKIENDLAQKCADFTIEDMKTSSKRKAMIDFMTLSLYTLTPPRRNADYIMMKLCKDGKGEDESFNYYDPKQKTFTFNIFKTHWKNGKEVIPCPLNLCKVIDKFCELFGVTDGGFILYPTDPKRVGGHITKTLNHIFQKKVGASMLRHFYDTYKYGDIIKEMTKDAHMMAHSVAEQSNYVKF